MNRIGLFYGLSKGFLLAMSIYIIVDSIYNGNKGYWIGFIMLLIYGIATDWVNSLPEEDSDINNSEVRG